MFEKITTFLVKKFAPIGILVTLFITIGLTVFEVQYLHLGTSEEIILYFFFTLLFIFFIFLLILKIFELSRQNPIKDKNGEDDE